MHVEAIGRQRRAGAIRPFDHRHPTAVERLLPTGGAEILAFEPIEIEVEEWQPSTEMLVQDHERRARNVGRIEPEARRDPLRQDGLSRPELAPQRDDIARPRQAREALAAALGAK